MGKQEGQVCLSSSSYCKEHASAQINGCTVKFTFSNGDDEKPLQRALEDLQSDYIGKSIMR